MSIEAINSEIISVSYTYETYFTPGHSNFLTGYTKYYEPVSPCKGSNGSATCTYKVKKVYGSYGELFGKEMVCSPDWQVGQKLDIELSFLCNLKLGSILVLLREKMFSLRYVPF